MAHGRRVESRIHALNQSAVIWSNAFDADAFIRTGELGGTAKKMRLDPKMRAAVDAKVDEYMTTGILTVEC